MNWKDGADAMIRMGLPGGAFGAGIVIYWIIWAVPLGIIFIRWSGAIKKGRESNQQWEHFINLGLNADLQVNATPESGGVAKFPLLDESSGPASWLETIDFQFPEQIALEHKMQDFLEDYTDSKYYLKEKGVKFVTSSKNRNKRYTQINGEVALCQKANQQFNWHGDFVFEQGNEPEFSDFVFDVNKVEEKYYLSDKVRDYVLSSGTKTFKTSVKTDLEVARPLLQSMHKMHRAGVDNYVTHTGRIRKLTPKECLRLMGFRDDFKQVVSDTQMYRQAGNSIVVDVLIALLKQMDITKFAK
jgi:site-specific DNA-cytosine methylase